MKKHISMILVLALSIFSVSATAEEMRRIDSDGYLYFMDYTGDYYSTTVMDSLRRAGYSEPGCSTFFTHNLDDEPITCRNYDIQHPVSKDDPTLTGLNVVLHCKPEGKYESIALADAIWCSPKDPLYRAGGPELEGFDSTLLDILPYQCMDGINEKGLFVSIMRVNIKEGDQPGRFGIAASMLVRLMLDDCANVKEAIAKVDSAIVTPEDWQECHVFVSDAQDHYALIESRNSVVSVIDTDVVTNFYLGYDDMEDYYKGGTLREEPVALVDKNGDPLYHFGYGHGYHRFVTIASQLARFRKDGRTRMPESSALVILRSAVQSPYTEVTGTSMTQYSAIYNNAEKTVSIWSFQNYETEYQFDVTGKQIH